MATTASRVALRAAYIGAFSDVLKSIPREVDICEIHTKAVEALVQFDQVGQAPIIMHTLSKSLRLGSCPPALKDVGAESSIWADTREGRDRTMTRFNGNVYRS